MARNMSFKLTTRQIKDGTKTVTRRDGWWDLRRGEIVNACIQCQGLKKGEKVTVIRQIRMDETDWLWCSYDNFLQFMTRWYGPAGVPDLTYFDPTKLQDKHKHGTTNTNQT